jgi:hypothetical protein
MQSMKTSTSPGQQDAIVKQPVVKLGFDPEHNQELQAVFADDIARTLWLLWRPGHLVGQDFGELCLSVAWKIRCNEPKTVADLRRCFPTLHSYWTSNDVASFCKTALPWFTGERQITFEVVSA